jgi:predicted ATPase
MKIASVHLDHFKRFTDLTIRGLGTDVRLAVLAGPNGSGKSSLFDAFMLWWHSRHRGFNDDRSYYRKGDTVETATHVRIRVNFHGQEPTGDNAARSFYFRTAYRNDPDFQQHQPPLQRRGPVTDERRFARMIESDAAVSGNYSRLASRAFEDAFALYPATTTLGDFREKMIGDIRDSVQRLFPGLLLNTLGNPLEDPTFRFDKGTAKSFDYKNLSGGEKAAFDLLLDLIVKRRELPEAIYCIDEPDAHMNARLQGALLGELYSLLPGQAQLWVATHSIGMMRKARELDEATPGTVAFLDFGDLDFDRPTVIEPSRPTRIFWHKQLAVAIDDLAHLVAPREVVICEGNPAGPIPGKDAEFDATCYDTIFGDEFPDVKFLSAGNAADVTRDRLGFLAALPKIAAGIKVRRLIDRDDHARADIKQFNADGISVLSRRNIESYLFDDEVLAALCEGEGKTPDLPAVIAAKKSAIASSIGRGNPIDDLKKASGDIFNDTRQILKLVGRGNGPRAFARATLAPLTKPGMAVYDELKQAIFGK